MEIDEQMKKITCLLLAACLLALCACGESEPGPGSTEITAATSAADADENGTSAMSDGTLTGLPALPKISLTASDPSNSKGLSETKIEFSYGKARNGKPAEQTLQNQRYFDSKGFNAAAWDSDAGKVLYLTFDCGWENGMTDGILDILKEKKVPAAFFCLLEMIERSPALVARMINEGHIVGNHSAHHPSFSDITRERMAREIEQCDNYLRENFGYTSKFFRFPSGNYSDSSLDLVQSLGYRSVFWSIAYADWDVNSSNGTQFAYNTIMSRLHPGGIILLHSVHPDNAKILGRIIDDARAQGYRFAAITEL